MENSNLLSSYEPCVPRRTSYEFEKRYPTSSAQYDVDMPHYEPNYMTSNTEQPSTDFTSLYTDSISSASVTNSQLLSTHSAPSNDIHTEDVEYVHEANTALDFMVKPEITEDWKAIGWQRFRQSMITLRLNYLLRVNGDQPEMRELAMKQKRCVDEEQQLIAKIVEEENKKQVIQDL